MQPQTTSKRVSNSICFVGTNSSLSTILTRSDLLCVLLDHILLQLKTFTDYCSRTEVKKEIQWQKESSLNSFATFLWTSTFIFSLFLKKIFFSRLCNFLKFSDPLSVDFLSQFTVEANSYEELFEPSYLKMLCSLHTYLADQLQIFANMTPYRSIFIFSYLI